MNIKWNTPAQFQYPQHLTFYHTVVERIHIECIQTSLVGKQAASFCYTPAFNIFSGTYNFWINSYEIICINFT